MVTHEKLGLPTQLSEGFDDWISLYWKRQEDGPFDTETFNAMGRQLAKDLKQFVSSQTSVVFVPELDDGSIGREEDVTLRE